MMDLTDRPKIQSIRFEDITLRFENQDSIFKNVDFDFPVEKIVWIRSSEGAGKSSLLQILAGLIIPQSGRYYLNDHNVLEMSFEDFLPYRLSIGYSFDYGGLISNRTLFDNLMLPLVYHKILNQEEALLRVQEVVKIFELERYIQERPAHVSGRVRKLVCLIRSMILHPQILLLDDPSIGIGVETQETLVQYIQEMRRNGILSHVFMSSYDEKFMSMLSETEIHIEEGLLYEKSIENDKNLVNL